MLRRGFTLIELLVVVAIIGVLASVVLASLNSARAKARDAVRKSDIRQIRTALNMYFSTYGRFPPETHCGDFSTGIEDTTCVSPGGSDWGATSDLRVLVTEGLIGKLPIDPTNSGIYYYSYEPDNIGQGSPPCSTNTCRFQLCANRLETTGGIYCVTDG